jgi:integrase
MSKPHPDFPLYQHKTGQWAKRIAGKVRYFGSWKADPDGLSAMLEYQRRLPWLLKGREPPAEASGSGTVQYLMNLYLTQKKRLLQAREIQASSYEKYKRLAIVVRDFFGKATSIRSLVESDYERLREHLAETRGPEALRTDLVRIRSMLRLGKRTRLVPKGVSIKRCLPLPPLRLLRSHRSQRKTERHFQPAEIRALLAAASPPVKVMVLLGIQSGFSNTDLALLPLDCLDREPGWLTYARAKTGTVRRVPLWKETTAAIQAAIAKRPKPKTAEGKNLLLLNTVGGNYVSNRNGNLVAREFRNLMKKCGLTGRSFYDLRRNFRTIGKRAQEPEALRSLMGHIAPESDMGARYDLEIDDAALQSVVQVVHDWLFKPNRPNRKRKPGRQRP